MRVVVDTNVLISALLADGKPRRLVSLLIDKELMVLSPQILAELADVLSRDNFVDIKRSRVTSFLSILSRSATVVSVKRSKRVILEDPEDDMVLTTARQGGASYVVSGDSHLLDLGRFQAVKIVNVEEMLRILT